VVALEDSYQYNGSTQGKAPKLRFVPQGFAGTQNQKINEVTVRYDTSADSTVTVFTLVVDPIPEFFAPDSPSSPLPKRAPKEARLPEPFRPVAHFFPGIHPDRRALIMSGVHGSEPEGVRMAEIILDELRSGRWIPEFNTLVIAEIFPRTQPNGKPVRGDPDRRWVHRDRTDKTVVGPRDAGAEPNRNFPLPGQSYATARELGRTRKDTSELLWRSRRGLAPPMGTNASQRLLPETRLLLALIERFRPHRLATLHSHSVKPARGDSCGIFVDPRGGVDPKSDGASSPEGNDDDELTRDMLCAFEQILSDVGLVTVEDPLRGNRIIADKARALETELRKATVHYSLAAPKAEGNSLGVWAPPAIAETVAGVAVPRGNRGGITTVTVEFPHGESDQAIQTLLRIHVEVLLSIFLDAAQTGSKAAHLAAPVAPTGSPGSTGARKPDIMKGCVGRP
jgi:hypothetical protein